MYSDTLALYSVNLKIAFKAVLFTTERVQHLSIGRLFNGDSKYSLFYIVLIPKYSFIFSSICHMGLTEK